jgi:uncharacterized protein YceK
MLINLGGLSLTAGHYMEPYGGVKVCLEGGTECLKKATDPQVDDRWWLLFGAIYGLALDLPMSAVADTVTLPITIRATLKGEAKTGPIQWGNSDHLFVHLPQEKRDSNSESSAK